MLDRSRMCFCRWIQHSSWNSHGNISLAASKDGIIFINYLHLKFRSVNCISISRPLKQPSKVSVWCCSQEYLFRKFSTILLSKHHWQTFFEVKFHAFSIFFRKHLFIFIYLFTHLILDIQTTFRLPSLIAKPFVGNTLKVKAGSPI